MPQYTITVCSTEPEATAPMTGARRENAALSAALDRTAEVMIAVGIPGYEAWASGDLKVQIVSFIT
jgi:hypothetical protein